MGVLGYTGGLTNPTPCAEDAEAVFLIQVGLSCLKRGHLNKKNWSRFHRQLHTYDWGVIIHVKCMKVCKGCLTTSIIGANSGKNLNSNPTKTIAVIFSKNTSSF